MAFDKNVGGHAFPERGGTCVRCGMAWERFMDGGKPRCAGVKPKAREPMRIEEDE
jgi:hypothetical protein